MSEKRKLTPFFLYMFRTSGAAGFLYFNFLNAFASFFV